MTRRSRRDPEGVRRASVEHGRGKPRNQTQGGKAPRKPRSGRSSLPTPERRGAALKRRLGAVGRFGVKHRGSLMLVTGSIAIALSLVLFEGVVQAGALVLSIAFAGAGAIVHAHRQSYTLHRSPNVYKPTMRERRQYTNDGRRSSGAVPVFQGGGPVTVSGSDRARPHTRARPGEAAAS